MVLWSIGKSRRNFFDGGNLLFLEAAVPDFYFQNSTLILLLYFSVAAMSGWTTLTSLFHRHPSRPTVLRNPGSAPKLDGPFGKRLIRRLA